MAANPDATGFALYPLTLFDNMSAGACMIKAWVIEGLLDIDKLGAALDRVVAKWPMLAGRVEITGPKRYHIRIPLGKLPESYQPYDLTFESSALPLSHYNKLPVTAGVLTELPPRHLFVPAGRDKLIDFNDLAKQGAPLTHWHITRFEHPGEEYTCLGVHYGHGLCDGVGFSMIMHALEAELAGKEWTVPPYPTPGLNENRFQTLIEAEGERARQNGALNNPYPYFSLIGGFGIVFFVLQCLWEQWWHGVSLWNIHIPYATHTKLVEATRAQAKGAGLSDVKISSGDVICAWIMKATYSDGTNPNRIIGLSNIASMRGEWGGELAHYPHNCYTSVPNPTFTVREATTLPLHQIAYRLAKARGGSRIPDAMGLYNRLLEADKLKSQSHGVAKNENAQEHLVVSNVSIARVSDLNWKAAGGKRNLFHYKYLPDNGIKPFGMVGINGRLDNGDLILNLILNNRRAKKLEEELQNLSV